MKFNFSSVKEDTKPVVFKTIFKNYFRAMKIIGEIDKDDIRGSFVTDTTEYNINGKVLNRKPLEVSKKYYFVQTFHETVV